MNIRKIQLIILAIILVFLPAFGLRCPTGETQQGSKPITLTYWGVWDDPDAYSGIIAKYQALHPNITIKYRKFRYEEYENELVNAFAEDRGPDIFSIHNTWVRKYQNKIEPMPASIKMVYLVTKGTVKKEVIPELRETKSITPKEVEDNFIDVVAGDVIIPVADKDGNLSDRIYALPLSVDTLALYYNKDLLNNAGITYPPQYWSQDFQQAVKKLTKQDTKGNIIQSGIGLGGSYNVERYTDILSVLMMQNGTIMMNGSQVSFSSIPPALKSQGYNPGEAALRFYTDFADPAREVYCWNNSLENSLTLFSEGKLALFLGYAYHLPTIKADAPKLNFSIAPLPQIENNQTINFANYWVDTVSKKSANADVAWDFIQFAAKAENVKSYLTATKQPTALRSLVDEEINDPDIGVFAGQLLTAKSWYKGDDANAMEAIFAEMIDSGVADRDHLNDVVGVAARQVQQTINKE